MVGFCGDLELGTSKSLFEKHQDPSALTAEVFEVLVESVYAEIDDKSLLYIPADRAEFYENYDFVSEAVVDAAGDAAYELIRAANCYALGEFTASVFHSARASELGVCALGRKLDVEFPNHPIELADMQSILKQVESKIDKMQDERRSTEKDQRLTLYSDAAAQFRYFKDAWRIRTAHARATFTQPEAKRILDHTRDYFEIVAPALKAHASE